MKLILFCATDLPIFKHSHQLKLFYPGFIIYFMQKASNFAIFPFILFINHLVFLLSIKSSFH